eukprot:5162799-Amphidinium_carterae.1
MVVDPQQVPLPESEDEGENLVQDEAEEEEVQDEEVEEEVDEDIHELQEDLDVPNDEQQCQHTGRQSFQRRRLEDGGEYREYRDQGRGVSGRRTYEAVDLSRDRNNPHPAHHRWSYKPCTRRQVRKRGEEDAFAAKLKEHHRHPLWRRCALCYRRGQSPSWVSNRMCSSCNIHITSIH